MAIDPCEAVWVDHDPEHTDRCDEVPTSELSAAQPMRAVARHIDGSIDLTSGCETPVPNVCAGCPSGHGAQSGGKQALIGVIGVGVSSQICGEMQRPSQIVVNRLSAPLAHAVASPHRLDHSHGMVGTVMGEEVRGVTVEEAEEAAADLAGVVFGNSVVLLGEPIIVVDVGKTHAVGEFGRSGAAIRPPHGLVP